VEIIPAENYMVQTIVNFGVLYVLCRQKRERNKELDPR
jgi:hypothetical protein